MTKLNLNKISKALLEDMPQAKYPKECDNAEPMKFKGASSGSLSTPSYDKMNKKQRTKAPLPPKMTNRNPSKNSGPETPPKCKKIKGSNSLSKGGNVKQPNMNVSSKFTKGMFKDADKVKRSEATPVKWSSTSGCNTDKLIGSVLKGLSQDSVQKIKFNVSKPNVNYGIVPTGDNIKCSQSHAMKKVTTAPKVVKEGVINGTTTIHIGSRSHVFEAASINMVHRMVENYASIGQEVGIDIKIGLRETYSDKKFVTSLLEAIHSKILDVDVIRKEKISEAFLRMCELLEDQFIPFHNRNKKTWIKECVKPAFKQAYNDFKKIYESHMEPYEVTVSVTTPSGREIVDVITRAINEDVAIHNAVEDISSELGSRVKFSHAYIGSKKYVVENSQSLLTKALSFDDMPEGFKDAGFGYKTTKCNKPTAPKPEKMKKSTKKRENGATMYSSKTKGGNKETLVKRKP